MIIPELLVNALIHRHYFIYDSVKCFVLANQIEITNPGKLPNSLTEEQMKKGIFQNKMKDPFIFLNIN
jgi:ATP-dependent DNA helicase RecG